MPPSVSISGPVRACRRLILLARCSRAAIASFMRLRIYGLRLKALMITAPCTVSWIVWISRVPSMNSAVAIWRTRRIRRVTPVIAIGATNEGDDRQERRLNDHHGEQREQGQEVAADAEHDHVEDVADGIGAAVHHHDQVARGLGGEVADAEFEEMVVNPPLVLRHDAVADAAHDHFLEVAGETLGERQSDDRQRQRHQHVEIAGNEDLVDDVLDDARRVGGGAGGYHHQEDGKQVTPPMAPEIGGEQPPDQCQRCGITKAEPAEDRGRYAPYDQRPSPAGRRPRRLRATIATVGARSIEGLPRAIGRRGFKAVEEARKQPRTISSE